MGVGGDAEVFDGEGVVLVSSLICEAWGPLESYELEHVRCPGIIRNDVKTFKPLAKPIVCGCECKTCKRAYWMNGRPIVQADGSIKRATD